MTRGAGSQRRLPTGRWLGAGSQRRLPAWRSLEELDRSVDCRPGDDLRSWIAASTADLKITWGAGSQRRLPTWKWLGAGSQRRLPTWKWLGAGSQRRLPAWRRDSSKLSVDCIIIKNNNYKIILLLVFWNASFFITGCFHCTTIFSWL